MLGSDFKKFRKELGKTQKEVARLLGVSLKAVHSYEQEWRNIPVHVERQLLFLISRHRSRSENGSPPCWEVKGCADDLRENCSAYEFNCGDLCWFVNGTVCNGQICRNWQQKMAICRKCLIFRRLMDAPPNQ